MPSRWPARVVINIVSVWVFGSEQPGKKQAASVYRFLLLPCKNACTAVLKFNRGPGRLPSEEKDHITESRLASPLLLQPRYLFLALWINSKQQVFSLSLLIFPITYLLSLIRPWICYSWTSKSFPTKANKDQKPVLGSHHSLRFYT